MIDGRNYGFTKPKGVACVSQATVIRADWLKAAGIGKAPSNLEALEAALYVFTFNDPDGNSANDTYGMRSSSDKENGKLVFAPSLALTASISSAGPLRTTRSSSVLPPMPAGKP